MRPTKPHLEFTSVALNEGWECPPGYKPGFWQKILSSNFDEVAKTGSRTRLVRIDAGAFSERPFVHDYWEEVYVIEGDLIVGNDADGLGGEKLTAPIYACRPPGALHGPVKSESGCLVFEVHYYAPE